MRRHAVGLAGARRTGQGAPTPAGSLWCGRAYTSADLAAAAMALSSLSVVVNATRLRRFRPASLPAAGPSAVEPQLRGWHG
jgi:Cu+-exporting ATPase